MKKGLVKLMAIVSTFAILLSQTAVSANYIFYTKDNVIDSSALSYWRDAPFMMPGFQFDSAIYSNEPRKGRKEGDDREYQTYGTYHGHLKWENNLMDRGWNAEDSQNIYPIGTPETNYMDINSPQTFSEAPYAGYPLMDLEFWNGYMFAVLEKVNAGEGDNDTTFDSVIQVWDVANGGKVHVANWDVKDMDFGGENPDMVYGIRDIEVTDEHIFMLVEMCGGWPHKAEYMTWGCALAIMDNNMSRADFDYSLPTKSALQQQIGENDRKNHGIDRQWTLRACSETKEGAEFRVFGEYLIYVPRAAGDSFKQLDEDSNTHGVWIAKWNDQDRNPTDLIEFRGKSFQDWLGITFPAEWHGTSYGNDTPDMKYFEIDGNYAYISVAYTVADAWDEEGNATDCMQYDKLYIADITDPTAPVIVGESMGIPNQERMPFAVEPLHAGRKMHVADGFVYIGQNFYGDWNTYNPYMYIIDVRDKANPTLAQALDLRTCMDDRDYNNLGGVDAITALGDYVVIQMRPHWTAIVQLNADKTEVVDKVYTLYTMAWGSLSNGSPEPHVYGTRIFYPGIGGGLNAPSAWTEEVRDPATGEVIETIEHPAVDEDGNWTSTDHLFRYQSRIETIDFGASVPMSFYIDNVVDNGDETYTLSGTVQGVNKAAGVDWEAVAITVYDTETSEELYDYYVDYTELEDGVSAEPDVYGWSFTTDPDMPSKLTFAVNDQYGLISFDGGSTPALYETINLDMIGVEPVFTLTADYSAEEIAAGDFTVTATGFNTTAKPVEGVIIVAVYDADGKLVAVTSGAPETVANNGEEIELAPVTVTVPAADSYDGYAVKTFMFNSVEGLAPACANLVF